MINDYTLPCTIYKENGLFIIGILTSRENRSEDMFYMDVDNLIDWTNGCKVMRLYYNADRTQSADPLYDLITKEALKIVAEHIMIGEE